MGGDGVEGFRLQDDYISETPHSFESKDGKYSKLPVQS